MDKNQRRTIAIGSRPRPQQLLMVTAMTELPKREAHERACASISEVDFFDSGIMTDGLHRYEVVFRSRMLHPRHLHGEISIGSNDGGAFA